MNSQECVAKGCAFASAQACGQYQAQSLEYRIIEYNQYDLILEGNLRLPKEDSDDETAIVAVDGS